MIKISKTTHKVLLNPKKIHHVIIIILSELVIGSILSLGSLFIFLKITAEIMEQEIHSKDILFSLLIYAIRTPFMTTVMLLVTTLGSNFTIITASVISILLAFKQHRQDALLLIIALFTGLSMNTFMKDIVQRPRPTMDPIILENSYSFPSGHAMNSFIFYGMLSYLVYHFTKNKKYTFFAVSFSIILVVLIGFSRIYLGVHFPSDIIAGYIAGFWWLITIIIIHKTIILYRLYHSFNKK
jgi:membrane-associated phospholipid phosphatase